MIDDAMCLPATASFPDSPFIMDPSYPLVMEVMRSSIYIVSQRPSLEATVYDLHRS